jgi:hypothetical protein
VERKDNYEIIGVDKIKDTTKNITIKDIRNPTNSMKLKNKFISESWFVTNDSNTSKYNAALFEIIFPRLAKKIYIMVGSGTIRTFETDKNEEIVSFFSTISSNHGAGEVPMVTIALGSKHLYVQDGGITLPFSAFNRKLKYDKQSTKTYIERMEDNDFSWEQLQDLELALEIHSRSKTRAKKITSADYSVLEDRELKTNIEPKQNKTKRTRCQNGTRRNKKTTKCEE